MERESNRGRGWLLVSIVAGLVLLSGIYPLVEEPENRVSAVAMIVVGAIALGVSAGPIRRGESGAWKAMWLFPVFLTLMAVFIAVTGDGTFGFIFIVFAAVAGLGLWLSRPVASVGKAETAT